ncbi:MAG: methionine synthase [Anaerolineaceae bacterium]|nr:methionine synthase [Anaerolineaceae bacterium]
MTTRTENLLSRLHAGEVFLADGATGTMLQSLGLENGRLPESWVVEQPDRVRALHESYVKAGSNMVLTCTLGGTRFRLAHEGLEDRAAEVNRRAAELARQAAGDSVFVAGDMSSTGQLLAPLGQLTAAEAADGYAEQAAALVEGGVDFLLVETLSDLAEARAAVEGARRVTDLPIFVTFSFDTHGRTMMGVRPAQAAKEMAPLVEGLGANCGRDPDEYPAILEAMAAEAPGAILWAKPNAGLPHLNGDEVVYDASPAFMAEVALRLRQAGAQIIGGCCGTTPEHIAAMSQSLAR